MKLRLNSITLVLILSFLLSGCMGGAFIAGAATGGTIAYDRRSLTVMKEDQEIAFKIRKEIKDDHAFEDNRVTVSSFNHLVLLAGQVRKMELRDRSEKIARRTPKVNKVFNEISNRNPITGLTMSNDLWITTKVKAQLLAADGLKSSQMKVVTEDGTVYLLGIVTRDQAALAASVARRVTGVRKVIRLFEFEGTGTSKLKTTSRFAT